MKATPYVTGGLQRIVLADDLDLPPSEQSVFHFEPLTVDELYELLDRVGDEKLQVCLEAVVRKLRRAVNFPSNAPVPYPADAPLDARKAYVAQLGVKHVYELGNALIDQQFVKDNGPESD